MTPQLAQQDWTETFQSLLYYYLPPLQPSPAISLATLACVAAGLFLVFRSMKADRAVVSAFGFVVGAWIGFQASRLIGTSGPIPAAIAAVLLTALAYKTYRWWLAAGSVIVLFMFATGFQLGRGDLRRYLPTPDQVNSPIKGDIINGLVSPERQLSNLHPQWREQVHKVNEKVVAELKNLGPLGWLLPAVAAIVGVVLAIWALRVFSVIWLSFLGASLATTGGVAFICAHWPNLRASLFGHPQAFAGITIGLWLLGLILQAKEARLPKKKPGPPAKDSPKS